MSDYSFFLSLTYDQANIPIKIQDNVPYFVFDKTHAQKYIKRVRYYINEMNPDLSLQYLCVSEYGGIGHRPHLHFLIFVKGDKYLKYLRTMREILRANWQYGFVCIESCEDSRIHYITKYCVKNLENTPSDCIDPVFILASKKPFLGSSFESTLEKQSLSSDGSPLVYYRGHKQIMPRIFRRNLGLAGCGQQMSDNDPRLSLDLERSFKRDFMKSHEVFDQGLFSKYVNMRLANYERLAIKKAIARNEKL